MRFGLNARFISLIAAVLTIIFAAITILIIVINTNRLRDGLTKETKAFAALATKPIGSAYVLYAYSGTVRVSQAIEKFTDLDPDIINVQVVDTQGRVLFNQHQTTGAAVSQTVAAEFTPTYYQDSLGNPSRIVYPYIEDFGLHRYAIVYDISATGITTTIAQTAAVILLAALLALIVTALATYLFVSRFFLRPITRISTVSALIRSGQYDQQIQLSRRDEIGDLATNVNAMANRLKADIAKLKDLDVLKSEFMTIAAHNLRTPITVIDGEVELMLLQKPAAKTKKMIESIGANSKRLGLFAEDMLVIAGLEAGESVFSLRPSKAEDIFQTLSGFDALAKEKGLKFSTDIKVAGRTLPASVPHLRLAIRNLLDNAVKFTEKGGQVKLSARTDRDRLVITIADTGIGIKPEEMPKLFTKFHRGTDVLQYNYEGTGIGLYLAKLIVDSHRGSINVSSKLAKGTTVTISLSLDLQKP